MTTGFDLFAGVADRRGPCRVVDLGCGTGALAIRLAASGHEVLAVDPNPEFLRHGRTKAGADRVTWVRGTSVNIPTGGFDVAVLTSNVVQEAFLTDTDWAEALADLRRGLAPGGTLCFDTRDPAARAWERWGTADAAPTRRTETDGTVVDEWTTVVFRDDVAWFDLATVASDGLRTLDPRTIEHAPGALWSRAGFGYRFRSADLVRATVEAAGFVVEEMFGGFGREPVGAGTGDLVVIATAR